MSMVAETYKNNCNNNANKALAAEQSELFDEVATLVLSSGVLRWYEAENLSQVNKACRSVWMTDLRETYPDWSNLLRELNSIYPTNRCFSCEKIILLKRHRRLCSIYDQNKELNGSISRWDKVSAQRDPDFHGVVDIVMRSGFLSDGKNVSISRTSKTCYKVHQEQCTCHRLLLSCEFLRHHPQYYIDDYENMPDFIKCRALIMCTAWSIRNLHSFYNFKSLANPWKVPIEFFGWPVYFNPMGSLQRAFPKRCALIMNMASLYQAQEELQRPMLIRYCHAFFGQRAYIGAFPRRSLGVVISKFCLPATDEVLIKFLRTKCYPTMERQTILGPFLIRPLSIFGPLMDMVPLDKTKSVQLPPSLEKLAKNNMKKMSRPFAWGRR